MESLMAFLNWVLANFGALNLVVFAGAVYTAWLHQFEIREHKETRDYTRNIQEKFIDTQLANIKVLHDLNSHLRNLDSNRS